MRYTAVAVAIVAGITLVSCNENEQPKPAPKSSFFNSLQGGTVSYSPNMGNPAAMTNQPAVTSLPSTARRPTDISNLTLSNQPTEKPPVEPAIQIPVDARWSLYCASVSGPDRFARIAQLKASLIERSGMKDWYVVHNEQDSTLFYGFYSAIEKTERASAKAHAERKRILELKNDQGDPLFTTCFFTPIVQPDPPAPAEWKLTNAPRKAFWSLEIAAFKDNVLRKQAAVELVKQLRAKGVEAYFFHGESISSVCIGAWPMEAVEKNDDFAGRTVSPDDDVLVSPIPLPERFQKLRDIESKDGHKIRTFVPRLEIADPSLKAAMAEYPKHMVNYEFFETKMRTSDGKYKMVPSPSLLVKIPGAEDAMLNGGTRAQDDGMPGLLNQIGTPPVQQDPMHQPGTSRLRGLGN
jgi:hypothetical protein